MPALNTNDGTGLKDLPALPQIPANVGKLDVGAIYDRVAQAAQTSAGLATQGSDMIARTSALATQVAKNRQTQQVIPSGTQADIATNTATAAQAPLGTVVAQTVADKAQQTTPSSIAATISANDAADTQNQVNKIYADANLQVAPTIANDTAQLQSGLYKRLKDSGQGMVTAPLTGPGGQPLGTMLVYTSPDGTPKTQVVPVPFGQLSHINTGIQYTPIGHKIDPATNQPTGMQWQTVYPNAMGGITRGEIVTTGVNDPAPGQIYQPPGTQPPAAGGAAPLGQAPAPAPPAAVVPQAAAPQAAAPANPPAAPVAQPPAAAAAAAAPVGGRIAAQVAAQQSGQLVKDRREFLEGLAAEQGDIDTKENALNQVRTDIDAEAKGTVAGFPLARVTGLAAHTPTGQQLDTDTSNFIGEQMKNAKNVRTQQEFNAYTGVLAKSGQFENVQRTNAERMQAITDARKQRVQFMQAEAAKNPNFIPSQLESEAIKRFPLSGAKPYEAPEAPASAAPPGASPQVTQGAIPPNANAVAYLKANPSMAAQFDAKYGQGEAAKILAAPAQ